MCFVLNLSHAVPSLSNANADAAAASKTVAVVTYVACAVPVSAIGVLVFVAKAVYAGQPCLATARTAKDGGHEGTGQSLST